MQQQRCGSKQYRCIVWWIVMIGLPLAIIAWHRQQSLMIVDQGIESDNGIDIATVLNISEHTIAEVTQSTDFDRRSKFQRVQIEKYCSKHGPSDFGDPLQNLNKQMIYDDDHKVIFCLVPKNGNTNIKRLFLVNQGLLSQDTISMKRVDHDVLSPVVAKISLANKKLTIDALKSMLPEYYKAMIVRNPLERLKSGFRDKLRVLLQKRTDFPYDVCHYIMKTYRHDDYKKWQDDTSLHYQVNFSDFIRYVIDTPFSELNSHFRPMINLCQPCTVQYDLYGAFKNFNTDSKPIIARLEASEEFRYNKTEHEYTEGHLSHYYSQLSQDLKEALFRKWYNELEFYYHLYPEERHTHKALLNIDKDIPIA